ncbi:MAG: hypothetical protein ABR606_16650 [Vicinamibacterales bacterium]
MIHLLPGPAGTQVTGARARPSSLVALALFASLTLAMAWPVTRDLGGSVPGDYGDPLFVMAVLGWVARHLTTVALGHFDALDRLWHVAIFHPEPNTLALSEHFVAQAVQVLPVYWLTGNLILCYNLALLSSFVLTGLGTFLLARDLWGRVVAALAAGVFAAFNEYRLVHELGHLHVLSIQWLPFALLGLHRFIAYGSTSALWGAGLAIVALNLSAGYYMMYCAPFIAVFAVVELARTNRLGSWRHWAGLAVAAVSVALVTVPFVLPYLYMQRRLGFVRSIDEVIRFSATLDHYRVALPGLIVPLTLAMFALVALVKAPSPSEAPETAPADEERLAKPIFTPGCRNPRRQRAMIGALFVFLALAFWLSLGPVVRTGGATLDVPGIYTLLYQHVPGFSGLRVAARFAALVLIFLPLLAAAGAAFLERQVGLAGRLLVLIMTGVFLWQTWPAALPVNTVLPSPGLASPPAYLRPSPRLPEIYRAVSGLDADAVIAELPFGDPYYEVRYMFFAATHGRRLLNGYSGIFPPSYLARQRTLASPLDQPAAALEALAPATHVIVHEGAWTDGEGSRLVAWLESVGAAPVLTVEGAHLLALRDLARDTSR